MSNELRRGIGLGLLGGALFTAAFLPMAVASADQGLWVPDPITFDATTVTGDPPYTELTEMGSEKWSLLDLTTNTVKTPDAFSGIDTHTVFGSFTNDVFAYGSGSTLDLTNFGGGWENEWLASPLIPGGGVDDLLITPFGDFTLLGPANALTI